MHHEDEETDEKSTYKAVSYTHLDVYKRQGVLSVCKHFPGHGDTEVDSHKALPVLNLDRARLDSIELFPFKEAVKAGLGGMMVGHLEVPESVSYTHLDVYKRQEWRCGHPIQKEYVI